jgi:mycothiol synthase
MRVLVADDLDDAGQVILDADFLRNRWGRDGFELSTDAWIVTRGDGTVVAYGHVIRDAPNIVESLGVVHPHHRGKGLGTALLERIDARARQMLAETSDPRFRHAINAGDRAAATLLRTRGLRPVRHFWHMEIDLDRPIDPGSALRGIEIRSIDADRDLRTVHSVLVEAFSQDWGFHLPKGYDEWEEEETGAPSFDPTLWLLATADASPVGALTASLAEDGGWVDYLGVVPSHRGRGIGGALLRRTFVAFRARGIRRALVSVDAENPTGATALYERVGMRVVRRWDLWERTSRALD